MKINEISEIDQDIQQIYNSPQPNSTASKIGTRAVNSATGAVNAIGGAAAGLTDIINRSTNSHSLYTPPAGKNNSSTQPQVNSNQYLINAQTYIKKLLNNTPIPPTASPELNKFLQQINLLKK